MMVRGTELALHHGAWFLRTCTEKHGHKSNVCLPLMPGISVNAMNADPKTVAMPTLIVP